VPRNTTSSRSDVLSSVAYSTPRADRSLSDSNPLQATRCMFVRHVGVSQSQTQLETNIIV